MDVCIHSSNMTCWLILCLSNIVCKTLFAENSSPRRVRPYFLCVAVSFSAELPQLAALPHTAPVTHLCLIRGNS